MLAPKSHPNILQAENTVLIVIDVQEPLLRAISEADRLLRNISVLIRGAKTLRIPVLATTQNKEKLGDVAPEIKSLLPSLLPPFDKMCFSCVSAPAFASELQRSGRRQVLLCGVETHICVSQTAHALVANGFQPHVAADAVASRTEQNWRIGLDRIRQGGALLTTTEAALYEMLGEAGTPEFREILQLVK